MPLDSARAKAKSFVFAEILRQYVNDPANIPYNWQENNFTFLAPGDAFLAACEPFEEVLTVRLQQTGGGFYDVYLERTDAQPPPHNSTGVGHIRR